MPNPPVTMLDRLAAVGTAATIACIIFAIGMALHKAISKSSPNKHIQGQPVVWWATILMFLGSCLGAWMADNQRYYLHEVVGGMSGFGLLAGLVLGNVHGFLNLYLSRTRKPERVVPAPDRPLPSEELQKENPFKPPRTL